MINVAAIIANNMAKKSNQAQKEKKKPKKNVKKLQGFDKFLGIGPNTQALNRGY